MMNNATKSFDILAISLNVPHNYFYSSTKFSDLYLTKFLNISAKSFFPWTTTYRLVLLTRVDHYGVYSATQYEGFEKKNSWGTPE